MTCRQVVEFLDEYTDGTLPPEARRLFEEHLAGCADCRAYLDSYRLTIRASRVAFQHPDAPTRPQPIPEELVSAIVAARRAGAKKQGASVTPTAGQHPNSAALRDAAHHDNDR